MGDTGRLLNFNVWIDTETCPQCYMVFGMPKDFQANKRQTGTDFYCPAGHVMSYRDNENARLKRQVEAANRNAEWQRTRAASIEKSLIAQKGVATKLRKRIANGVCPCCKRSFNNLHQHMTKQHPDYAKPVR